MNDLVTLILTVPIEGQLIANLHETCLIKTIQQLTLIILMSPHKDKTRFHNVVWTIVDGSELLNEQCSLVLIVQQQKYQRFAEDCQNIATSYCKHKELNSKKNIYKLIFFKHNFTKVICKD